MKLLITGGCGFIGCNAALEFSRRGWDVAIIDNLSRAGSEQNYDWMKEQIGFRFYPADIRRKQFLAYVIKQEKPDAIIHLAAQVAVTTSIKNPREDFEINAIGTLNILESMRAFVPNAILINASTNKVYGQCSGEIDEDYPLNFQTPYACSKGAAEQYVLDYHRTYDLRTVNFRQSCVYGPRQFGTEDQGWLAWFMRGEPITIYGNGEQVRDILHVHDLIDAYFRAIDRIEFVAGENFNVGGGLLNAISLLETIKLIESFKNETLQISFGDERPGDQKIYISHIRKALALLGWEPRIRAEDGLRLLFEYSNPETLYATA